MAYFKQLDEGAMIRGLGDETLGMWVFSDRAQGLMLKANSKS